MVRGRFIVFEGGDGTGKTTQSLIITDWLNRTGRAKRYRFPDRTTAIGGIINQVLTKATTLPGPGLDHLMIANRWEVRDRILKDLNDGIDVIADRYAISGIVYSSFVNGQDLQYCCAAERGLPKPDIIYFLSLDPDTSLSRITTEEIYEVSDVQTKVLTGLNFLSGNFHPEVWARINAARPREQVTAEIMNHLSTISNDLPPISNL